MIFDKISKYIKDLFSDIKGIGRSNFSGFFKKRIKLIGVLTLILLMVLGYFIGSVGTSKNTVLSKIEVALREGNKSDLKKFVRIDGDNVRGNELDSLVDYYKGNTSLVDSTIRRLKDGEETPVFILKEEKGILGNDYFLDINTYNIKVDSNFTEAKFSLDGKEFISSGESFESIVPGVYNIIGKLSSDYGEFEISKDIVLMKNENINMNFDAIEVLVNSVFDDANIFINDKDSGIKVGDKKKIGPLPTDGSVKMHIERDFPWGHIKGEDVVVKDIQDINLSISIENEALKGVILSDVDEFYRSVFESLNSEEKDIIVGATNEARDKIFNVIEKKYFVLKNKYIFNNINIVEDKSKYFYEDGKYRATIVVEINYDITKKWISLSKENKSNKIFTRLVYDNNEWIIEDIENFSL